MKHELNEHKHDINEHDAMHDAVCSDSPKNIWQKFYS